MLTICRVECTPPWPDALALPVPLSPASSSACFGTVYVPATPVTSVLELLPFALLTRGSSHRGLWLACGARSQSDSPLAQRARAARGPSPGPRCVSRFLTLWGHYRLFSRPSAPVHAASRDAESCGPPARLGHRPRHELYDPKRAEDAPASGPVDPTVAAALNRALEDIGRAHRVVPARPKSTLLDAYFRRAGVDGMTDPFFLETLIASDLLPFERPFTVAHEWSHLAGIADEGEANFVGWLACVRASPAAQYSRAGCFCTASWRRPFPSTTARRWPRGLGRGPRADLRGDSRTRTPHVTRACPAPDGASTIRSQANRVQAARATRKSFGWLGARLPSGRDPMSP